MATQKAAPAKKTVKSTRGLVAPVFDVKGAESGTMELPDMLFKVTASPRLLAQYVRIYLSNQRQGTHAAKTRGLVRATTKKVYRQKGTGRARHGARTAPLFVGGGVAHGPVVRTHALQMSKKQRQKALLNSLTLKADQKNILVVSDVPQLTGKTKEMATLLKNLQIDPRKSLVVYAPDQAELCKKLLGNIAHISTSQDRLLHAYAVLKAEKVLFTQEALNDFISFRSTDAS